MRPAACFLLLCLALSIPRPLRAQLPFYTDDPAVTGRNNWHFEFFNEFDALQLQYPNLRQNTANSKLNYALRHTLELDIDTQSPSISRAAGPPGAAGPGDLTLGVKWQLRKESARVPALGASLYIEFPTGDSARQLGSGLTD